MKPPPLELIAAEHLPTRPVRNDLGASDGHHECERGDENENVPTYWQPPSAPPFGVGPARHSVPDVDFALQAM